MINSTSGYIFLYNGRSISWKSFKQSVITNSIIKVEYIAASKGTKKAFWFKKFVLKLNVMPSDAIVLHYDNNGAIALAKEHTRSPSI